MKKLFSIFAVVALATVALFSLNSCTKDDDNKTANFVVYIDFKGETSDNVNIIADLLGRDLVAIGYTSEGSNVFAKEGKIGDLKKQIQEVMDKCLDKIDNETILDNTGMIVRICVLGSDEVVASHTMKSKK